MSNATLRTTLAVFRPTPASDCNSLYVLGTTPSKRAIKSRAIETMFFAFERYKPIERMYGSTSAASALARLCASGYASNSFGVTLLTEASVVCADKITATTS